MKSFFIMIFVFASLAGFKLFARQTETNDLEGLTRRSFYYNGNTLDVEVINSLEVSDRPEYSCDIFYGDELVILGLSGDGRSVLVEEQRSSRDVARSCIAGSQFYLPREIVEDYDFSNRTIFHKGQIVFSKNKNPITAHLAGRGGRLDDDDDKGVVEQRYMCTLNYGDRFEIFDAQEDFVLVELRKFKDKSDDKSVFCEKGDLFYLLRVDLTDQPPEPVTVDIVEDLAEPYFYYSRSEQRVNVVNALEVYGELEYICKIFYGDKLKILGLSENEQSVLLEKQSFLIGFSVGCRANSQFYLPREIVENYDFFNYISFHTDQVVYYKSQNPVTLYLAGRDGELDSFQHYKKEEAKRREMCPLNGGDRLRILDIPEDSPFVLVELKEFKDKSDDGFVSCRENDLFYLLRTDLTAHQE